MFVQIYNLNFKLYYSSNIYKYRLFTNYEYADSPPPLRSDHLDLIDAQRAKKNDGHTISCHIISRLGAAAIQKGCFGHPKIQLSYKLTIFAG